MLRRIPIDKVGYQTGLATTRPRNAKNGAAAAVTSLSPLASIYVSQNDRNSISKGPRSRPRLIKEVRRKFIVIAVRSSAGSPHSPRDRSSTEKSVPDRNRTL